MQVEVEGRTFTLTATRAKFRELSNDLDHVAEEGVVCEIDVALMTPESVGNVTVRFVPTDLDEPSVS